MKNRTLKRTSPAVIAALIALSAVPLQTAADVLLIDTVQQAPPNTAAGIARPVRGMTMDDVERIYGSPVNKRSAVGDPPITRWVYDHYTVVFEKDTVLHSVVHRPKQP